MYMGNTSCEVGHDVDNCRVAGSLPDRVVQALAIRNLYSHARSANKKVISAYQKSETTQQNNPVKQIK